jgi:hypothetical protein
LSGGEALEKRIRPPFQGTKQHTAYERGVVNEFHRRKLHVGKFNLQPTVLEWG